MHELFLNPSGFGNGLWKLSRPITKFLKEIPPTPKFEQARPISALQKKSNPLEALVPRHLKSGTPESAENTETIENAENEEESKSHTEAQAEEGNDTAENESVEDTVSETQADDSTVGEFEGENEEADEDDEEGWITPDNFNQIMLQADKPDEEDDRVFVACCTTDFAMQVCLPFYTFLTLLTHRSERTITNGNQTFIYRRTTNQKRT